MESSRRDTITMKTFSLFQVAYTVPLCSIFLYFTKLMLFGPSVIHLSGVTVSEDLHITFYNSSGHTYLQGISEFNLPEGQNPVYCRFQQNHEGSGCLEYPHHQMITVVEDESSTERVECFQVKREGLRCVSQMVKDCYNLGNRHWYGGFETTHHLWPLKKAVMHADNVVLTTEDGVLEPQGIELTMGPYVTSDSGIHKTQLQNVLERLFISSSGVGIMVSGETPLYLSFNQHGDGQICLAAMYDGKHFFSHLGKTPMLDYTVCKARDVKEIHSYMTRRFISKPLDIPSVDLFTNPIWSTRALYKKEINQSAVMDFVGKIEQYNLPCSQIEIDDEWTTHYGDLDFDTNRFPDPKKMVSDLNERGFPVTLWVHPFINLNSKTFQDAHQSRYLIMTMGSETPALVKWWNGEMAALLDVTNPAAALWYQKRLEGLRKKYDVTSFKFDGGEAQFVPHSHLTYHNMTSTNEYSSLWVELAFNCDQESRRQEVRTAWHTQHLPIFLRLHDRMSTWSSHMGLRSVIPAVLTLGVIGYPYILPDMIGGNAYADVGIEQRAYPGRELYIRWMQVTAFLPSMQISVTPWIYDNEVVDITRKVLLMRQKFAPLFVNLARDSVETGNPIVRPLWWVDPLAEEALVTDDEYLVGNDLLVAPVVIEGARKRNVYLPDGSWRDVLRGRTVVGPTVLKDYAVAIDELAYFERVNN